MSNVFRETLSTVVDWTDAPSIPPSSSSVFTEVVVEVQKITTSIYEHYGW